MIDILPAMENPPTVNSTQEYGSVWTVGNSEAKAQKVNTYWCPDRYTRVVCFEVALSIFGTYIVVICQYSDMMCWWVVMIGDYCCVLECGFLLDSMYARCDATSVGFQKEWSCSSTNINTPAREDAAGGAAVKLALGFHPPPRYFGIFSVMSSGCWHRADVHSI